MMTDAEKIHDLEIQIAVLKSTLSNYATYTREAVDKAERLMNIRLEGMNEFREQLKDQTSTFVTVEVFDTRLLSIETKLSELQSILWKGLGAISVVIFFVGVAVPLLLHFF
jgi:arginine utilization protein RocB